MLTSMSVLLVAQCWGSETNDFYDGNMDILDIPAVEFGDSREIEDMWGAQSGLCVKFQGDRPNLKCVNFDSKMNVGIDREIITTPLSYYPAVGPEWPSLNPELNGILPFLKETDLIGACSA
jgi:hypothetical protein